MKLCPHCNQPLDWKNYCASCDIKITAFGETAGRTRSADSSQSSRNNSGKTASFDTYKKEKPVYTGTERSGRKTPLAIIPAVFTTMMIVTFGIVMGFMSNPPHNDSDDFNLPKIPQVSVEMPDFDAIAQNAQNAMSQAQEVQAQIQEILDKRNLATTNGAVHNSWKEVEKLPYLDSKGTEGNMIYYYTPDVIEASGIECESYHMNTNLSTMENTVSTLSLNATVRSYDDDYLYSCYYQDMGDVYFTLFSQNRNYLFKNYTLILDYDPASHNLHKLRILFEDVKDCYTDIYGYIAMCGGMAGWSYADVLSTLQEAQQAVRELGADGFSETCWFYTNEKIAVGMNYTAGDFFLDVYPRTYYDDLMQDQIVLFVPKTE